MNSIKLFSLLFCISSFISFGQVQYSASETEPCVNSNVTFTNTGPGAIINWDMGDGTTYNNQQSVVHQFANGQPYYVEMEAYSATMTFLGNYGMWIYVVGPPQEITMPTVACPGDQVSLDAWMQDGVSWAWDYGDGTAEQGYNYTEHVYNSPGTYYPEVTITSPCGTFVIQDTITITNSLPFFMYNTQLWVSPDSVCPNTEIYADTYGGFSGYSWDFGDGNFASGNNYVNHLYTSTGTYNLQLTVTNGCGVDTLLSQNVVVSNATPVQNPNINLPDTICPNEQFYADAYANDGVTYDWDMDDGSPVFNETGGMDYTYTSPGIYNPTVTITNDCGNSVVLTQTVVVDPNGQVNNPYLNLSTYVACPGDEVDFGTNNSYQFYVDFGDGSGTNTTNNGDIVHSYSSPGTYIVSSTMQNACGNSTTVYDTISIQTNLPVNPGNINFWHNPSPACPTDPVEFEGSSGYSDYSWDFNDGSTGQGQVIDHIYNAPGTYNVTLTVTNGCGSQGSNILSVVISDGIQIGSVDIFNMTDTICLGDNVFMQAEGDDGYDYLWDLGDGNTETGFAFTHEYDALGTYTVTLTATNGCGNDSTITTDVVVSNNYTPDPANIFTFVQQEGCVGDELLFAIIPSGLGTISWDFGDGNSTTTINQVFVQGIANVDVAYHAYSAPGTYWATYTLTNSCGNTVVDSMEVTVGTPGTVFNIDVDLMMNENQTICQETPIEFMAVGASTYIWDFGDGSGQLVTTGSLSPLYHTYTEAGSYTVTVQGVDACGNMGDSDETIVIPPSKIEVSTNTVTKPNCGMNNGLAVVSASGGVPPYSYSWTNGDQGVIADSLQSGIYVVTVTDFNGCENEGSATVSDQEGVTILVDNVVDVDCYGEANGSISVSLLGGQAPYTILWSNGDQTEDIFGLQAGPYEIFVTDANGCFAVQTIDVTQPAKTNISILTQPATCGGTNGLATATLNNGTGPFNYIWPNSTGPSNTAGALPPGSHTLYVIDGNTCLLEKTFSINEAQAPIIISDSTVTGTCNGTLSSVYISTIGGQQPFTFNWSDGSTNQDLSGVVPGNYTVEVTGNNGCSSFANYVVEETQPEQVSICVVGVDTLTETNLVVWTPSFDPGVASYNIYKESSQAGLYYLIGNSSADSISQYFDTQSDPSIRSWRYKVATVDDCGNEAEWSDEHKTMHLTANKGVSGEVNLIWDDYEGFSYSSFMIERHHPTTGWEVLDTLPANLFTYTDQNTPGDSNLVYRIWIETPGTCTAEKAQDYNSSRSNKEGVNVPAPQNNNSGIEENDLTFNVYPNPTDGIVQIRYDGVINEIRLYDMSGKLIYSNVVIANIAKIDMKAFERGVYNVQLLTEKGLVNGKVIRD